MDEEEEEDADYSRLFDTSPPPSQAADPLPQHGSGPSVPSNESSSLLFCLCVRFSFCF